MDRVVDQERHLGLAGTHRLIAGHADDLFGGLGHQGDMTVPGVGAGQVVGLLIRPSAVEREEAQVDRPVGDPIVQGPQGGLVLRADRTDPYHGAVGCKRIPPDRCGRRRLCGHLLSLSSARDTSTPPLSGPAQQGRTDHRRTDLRPC